MANISNLKTINGEYVKFYITTNSQLPNLLKNTGSVVIYSDSDLSNKNTYNGYPYSYSNNYIYLAGELIASGWGASTKEIRDKLENIAYVWDSTYSYMYDSYTYMLTAYSYLLNKITNDLVLADGGIINKTHTTYIVDGIEKYFNSEDLLLNKIEADYKPLEITKEYSVVKYNTITNVDYIENLYETNTIGNYSENSEIITLTSYNNEIFEIPVGSRLASVEKVIEYNINDEKSIKSIGFKFSYNNTGLGDINIENSIGTYVADIFDTNSNVLSIQHKYSDIANSYYDNKSSYGDINQYFVDYGEYEILSYIQILTYGQTLDELKPIKISYINDLGIISSKDSEANSYMHYIEPRLIHLNSIKIKGSPFIISYQVTDVNNIDNIYTDSIISYYGNRFLLKDINKISINKNSYSVIFGLPKNTVINEIYYIDKFSNNKINITGAFVNFNKDFYLTYMPYNKIKNNNNYVEYDLYTLKYSDNNKFFNNIDIYIDIDNKFISKESLITEYNYQGKYLLNNNEWKNIKNTQYISHNWIHNTENNFMFNMLGNDYKYYTTNSINNIYNDPLNNWNELSIINDPFKSTIEINNKNAYYILPKNYMNMATFVVDNTSSYINYTYKDIFNTDSEEIFTKENLKYSRIKRSNENLNISYFGIYQYSYIGKFTSNNPYSINQTEESLSELLIKYGNYFNDSYNLNEEIDNDNSVFYYILTPISYEGKDVLVSINSSNNYYNDSNYEIIDYIDNNNNVYKPNEIIIYNGTNINNQPVTYNNNEYICNNEQYNGIILNGYIIINNNEHINVYPRINNIIYYEAMDKYYIGYNGIPISSRNNYLLNSICSIDLFGTKYSLYQSAEINVKQFDHSYVNIKIVLDNRK